MKITILNGNPDPAEAAFDGRLAELAARLERKGHSVHQVPLRDLDIRQCTGCFACWLKTPGRCVLPDEYETVLRHFVSDDLVVFSSPLVLGFTSALLKRATDRIIPIALPHIDGASGECRHYPRYDHTPKMGVLFAPEPDTDAEDREILETLWRRFFRNANAEFAFIHSTHDNLEEVTHAIDRL